MLWLHRITLGMDGGVLAGGLGPAWQFLNFEINAAGIVFDPPLLLGKPSVCTKEREKECTGERKGGGEGRKEGRREGRKEKKEEERKKEREGKRKEENKRKGKKLLEEARINHHDMS